MEYRLFNYPGNKLRYCPILNNIIDRATDSTKYVEPFCGTASVLLNLRKHFDTTVINDFSREVMIMLQAFRDGSYSEILGMYAKVAHDFGDIRNSKEAYYNFRNAYNTLYFKTNTIEEGFFLYMCSRSAINSLFRIGPKGFNNSFGNRANKLGMTLPEFTKIQSILKATEFNNKDYREVIAEHDGENTLFFMDPPYADRKVQGSYKDENAFDQDEFLDILQNIKGKVVYTDLASEYISIRLGSMWKSEILSDKKNISPGRNKDKTKIDYVESVYYNF